MISQTQQSNIDEGDIAWVDAILKEHLRPPKQYSVSEWADEFRVLSQRSSSEHGKWRTSRTPYLKQIMDDLSESSPVQDVIFMKGSQIGGSESGNNWIAYVIDHAPAPTMIILPTLALAKRNSKQRIQPLIDDTPSLRNKVSATKTHEASNTILEKDFPGGTLFMTGANSAVGLRSTPAKNLMFDEIDAYPLDADGEGDPVKLAEARSRTFTKRKRYKVSTPTIEGRSRIAKYYADSDQRKFFVPCPECNHYQELVFNRLKWPENEPKKAVYLCENCEFSIENWQKTSMLAKGVWKATVPENADPKTTGYHLNALYSPVGWYSWGEIACDFIEAKKDKEALKTFVNTVLGETWKEKTERPEWQRLYERRESYPIGKVPPGGLFLTCGVDVQKDRIEAEVVAWGRNKVSWSVDYRVFLGDTSNLNGPETPWQCLEKLLNEFFPRSDNDKIGLPIKLTCVDSGFNTQTVYSFCRKFSPTKVLAIKGRDKLGVMFTRPTKVDVNVAGKDLRRGLRVWTIGVDVVKSELYGWLQSEKAMEGFPDPYGFCHFPDYEAEFFKQLTAEQVVTKVVKGFKQHEWVKVRDRNEALDCRAYARAASAILGIDRYPDDKWKSLENEVHHNPQFDKFLPQQGPQVPQANQPQQAKVKLQRRRSTFL